MPEEPGQGPRAKDKERRLDPEKASLLQSLREAHEADHELLDALGVKHPHL